MNFTGLLMYIKKISLYVKILCVIVMILFFSFFLLYYSPGEYYFFFALLLNRTIANIAIINIVIVIEIILP